MVHRLVIVQALTSALLLTGSAVAAAAGEIVFAADFDRDVPKQFSGITTTSPVQGYEGVGWPGNRFGGRFLHNKATGNPATATTLTLTDLPAHTSIDIGFLLALIDSWDGSNETYGPPDVFNVKVDDKVVFSRFFSNFSPAEQEYRPPRGGQLLPRPFVNIGFDGAPDSAYDMGKEQTLKNIPHTAATLKISWYASGAAYRQEETDESWAIDNVVVILNGTKALPAQKSDSTSDRPNPLREPRACLKSGKELLRRPIAGQRALLVPPTRALGFSAKGDGRAGKPEAAVQRRADSALTDSRDANKNRMLQTIPSE